MSYSISSSTKILTLTTAPFFFILVGALSACQFARSVLCPQEEDLNSFLNSKRFKLLSVTISLWQGHC